MNTAIASELQALWKLRNLLWVLTKRDLQSRNTGSIAGVLWLYIPPILTVALYYLVFDVVFSMRLGEKAPVRSVGIYLITGMLPWMAFCDAIARSMNSINDASQLLQKNPLPATLFPAKSVASSAIVYGPILLLVSAAYAPINHYSGAAVVLFPLFAFQILLSWGLGYIFALIAVAVRDLLALVGFLLSIGVFISPILFPIELFPAEWRWVLWINPMTPLITAYQSILLSGDFPALNSWIALMAWFTAIFLFLSTVIERSREHLVDWL